MVAILNCQDNNSELWEKLWAAAPYFHDGGIRTLDEAVRQIAWLQLGKKLEQQSTKLIVSFLRSLSGKNR